MIKPDEKVEKIRAGGTHTCAVLVGGGLRCWGSGLDGRLGYGSTSSYGGNATIPGEVKVNVDGEQLQILDVVLSSSSTCVLLEGNHVRCWGRNDDGQLGLGHTQNIGDEGGEMPPSDAEVYPNP